MVNSDDNSEKEDKNDNGKNDNGKNLQRTCRAMAAVRISGSAVTNDPP